MDSWVAVVFLAVVQFASHHHSKPSKEKGLCLSCCGGVSDTTKVIDNSYYSNTWCELRSPCCVPSSGKKKRCHSSCKTDALGAVVPACLNPLSVGITGTECQNKFLMQTWKQLRRCFSGDILKLGQTHHCGAACREGLQMTWQYCGTLCEMCGSLNSFCSFSEFLLLAHLPVESVGISICTYSGEKPVLLLSFWH